MVTNFKTLSNLCCKRQNIIVHSIQLLFFMPSTIVAIQRRVKWRRQTIWRVLACVLCFQKIHLVNVSVFIWPQNLASFQGLSDHHSFPNMRHVFVCQLRWFFSTCHIPNTFCKITCHLHGKIQQIATTNSSTQHTEIFVLLLWSDVK